MSSPDDPRLLYIVGRGHSGSTVLDSLVGAAGEAFGTGELVAGMRRYDRLCACGETIANCPLWTSIRRRFAQRSGLGWDEASRSIQEQANVRHLVSTWRADADDPEIRGLAEINRDLLAAITEEARASTVVESSKEVTRALFLARFLPEARLVHLVRNPEDMLASTLERIRDGTGFRFMRRTYTQRWLAPLFLLVSTVAWLIGNLLAEMAARRASDACALRLRYEDLCADATGQLRRIGVLTGLDVDGVIAAVEAGCELPLGHRLAGNRLLEEATVRFDPSRVSSRELPVAYRLLCRVVAWPLMLRYGYLGRGNPA